jgi:hypothetical protein
MHVKKGYVYIERYGYDPDKGKSINDPVAKTAIAALLDCYNTACRQQRVLEIVHP